MHRAPGTVHGASGTGHPSQTPWKRNVYVITAASFMGYTGFTLVMPFLPLFIAELGVADVAQVALWTGICLGITPGLTAILAPAWGRLGDRYGRKIMVERSLISFTILMAAMAYVTNVWHVLAIRIVQGLFAGYGSLSVAMAAESAPRDRMPNAIGLVQTAQRLGPGLGPVIGGALAHLVGLRRAFLVTALFYFIALVLVHLLYVERRATARAAASEALAADETLSDPPDPSSVAGAPAQAGRVTFRNVLAFQNFILMMFVIFALQFVDRSFGPVLPLYVQQIGVPESRVAIVSGVLFSIMAGTGAVGHHVCGRLLKRYATRAVIAASVACAAAGCGLFAISTGFSAMSVASTILGLGIGVAMTAAYTAAGSVIPAGAHGAGFGVLTSASLIGMASSPFVAGSVGGASITVVFVIDCAVMAALAGVVHHRMVQT